MAELKDLFQSADWNKEKHVPVVDAPDAISKGEAVKVSVSVGKAIPHPNTTEHHIRWIKVFFLADGEKFPCEAGSFEFTAHGESAQGPNTGAVYSNPEVSCVIRAEKSGVLFVSSYCNIHGLWQNAKRLEVK